MLQCPFISAFFFTFDYDILRVYVVVLSAEFLKVLVSETRRKYFELEKLGRFVLIAAMNHSFHETVPEPITVESWIGRVYKNQLYVYGVAYYRLHATRGTFGWYGIRADTTQQLEIDFGKQKWEAIRAFPEGGVI